MKYVNKFLDDIMNVVLEGYGSKLVYNDDIVWNWCDYFEYYIFLFFCRNLFLWFVEFEFYRYIVEEYSGEIKKLVEILLFILLEYLGIYLIWLQEVIGVLGVYQNINFGCYLFCFELENVYGMLSYFDYSVFIILW